MKQVNVYPTHPSNRETAYLAQDAEKCIPAALQEIDQWIVWKAGPLKPDGKFDKFPKGRDGTGKAWQKPEQWMSFQQAQHTASKWNCSGIGFVLPAITSNALHVVALDFDDVNLSTEINNPRLDEIREIHQELGEPFVESSPSGKGLRMFVKSSVPIPQTSAPNPLGGKDEIFGESAGKWVTITGFSLGGSGLPDATQAILDLQCRIASRTTGGTTKLKATSSPPSTLGTSAAPPLDELTKTLAKGWTGWPSRKLQDGDGREAAMLGYAGHLRASGYTQVEIEACCLKANTDHYEHPLEEEVVLDRARRYQGHGVRHPGSNQEVEDIEPDLALEDRTDAGNVSVLVRVSGNRLRYVPELNLWIVAEKNRWMRDPHLKHLHHEQLKVAAKWQRKAKLLRTQAQDPAMSEQDQKRLIQTANGFDSWANQCRNKARLDPMRTLAERDARFVVEANRLDVDPWLLGVANGVINLQSGTLIEDSLTQFILKRSEICFAPNAQCPRWEKFIEEITSSPGPIDTNTKKVTLQTRPDLAATLQRILGYCLSGSTREHKIFIACGAGANGKNVLFDTVQRIISDYTISLPPELLMSANADKHVEAASPMMRMLQGVRLVVCSESKETHSFDTSAVKRLTGGGALIARGLHEKPVQFEMTHKLILTTNNRPNLANIDAAIRGRIVLFPFDFRWNRPGEADPDPTLHDADKNLSEKLWAEREGILRWLIEGAVDYQKRGLDPCSSVVDSTVNYLDKQDPFRRWFRTLVHCDPAQGQTASDLSKDFGRFCREDDETSSTYLSAEQIGRKLKQLGIESKKTAVGARYGLQARKRPEADADVQPSVAETLAQIFSESPELEAVKRECAKDNA